MQILFNGEELDVQLEDERLVGDVLCKMANWLESGCHYLKKIVIDGTCYFAAEQGDGNGEWNSKISQLELENVECMEIFSAPNSEVKECKAPCEATSEQQDTIWKSLKILDDYFRIARKAFEDQQFLFLQDFFSDSAALLELLQGSVAKVGQCEGQKIDLDYENPLFLELQTVLELWNYFQDSGQNAAAVQAWQSEGFSDSKERMLAILQDVSVLLTELREDYEVWLQQSIKPGQGTEEIISGQVHAESVCLGVDSELSITEIQRQLAKKSQELIEELGHLQSGQVQQSLYHVSGLSLLLEQLLRQEGVQGKHTFTELFTLLKPFLYDLAVAIKNTDTVTISDLVEYEIVPLIQQIIDELG